MRERLFVRIIIGAALVAIIAAGLFWFFSNYERATRDRTTGYSREALRNPLLAAQRFLVSIGAQAQSVSIAELWRDPPLPDDVVIINRYSPPRATSRQQQLRSWVESGGHLIIDADALPDEDEEAEDELLAELGARKMWHKFEEDEKRDATVGIRFAGFAEKINVTMSARRYLSDDNELAVAGAPLGEGYGLLQYEVGEGYVTILADNAFLSNREIGKEEHALALALLAGIDHDARIWLVHDIAMPPLTTLAWQYAPQAIIATALGVLLWLWSLTARLGPQLPPLEGPRRDLGEHLRASAHYLWKLDRCSRLQLLNRQRIEQAWLGKHYALRNMPLRERCEWIAARSGLSAVAVERALYGEHDAEGDFIEISSYLQVLRAAL